MTTTRFRPHRPYPLRYLLLSMGAVVVFALPSVLYADASDESCIAEEPDAYRMTDFRAVTPCTLRGATVLSADQLADLIASDDPILIDVLPAQRRPKHLDKNALWLPPARNNIAQSVWLPNTGFGILPIEEERYLRDNLLRLTHNDAARALVFYCDSECWMSWNAARRAIEWGYSSVYWYPDGSDGWAESGRPLEASEPVPRGEGQ